MKTDKTKYTEVLKKLHICKPTEKKALYRLLNFYYARIHK